MAGRRLISADEAVQAKAQHTKPCSDCPWARTALNGWLGGVSAQEWIQRAHGEAKIPCHTLRGAQCAGLAIYRANVCKSPRDPSILRLPADREKVFATPMEFTEYHERMYRPKQLEHENEDV